jgi:hypothetical protein
MRTISPLAKNLSHYNGLQSAKNNDFLPRNYPEQKLQFVVSTSVTYFARISA